jgi:hypothetical protein
MSRFHTSQLSTRIRVTSAIIRNQNSPNHIWFIFNDAQESGGGAVDAAFALFPFLVALYTHANERCHLRLIQFRAFARFEKVERPVHGRMRIDVLILQRKAKNTPNSYFDQLNWLLGGGTI